MVIKNFFLWQSGGQDIFFLFSHKLSITFVLHAIPDKSLQEFFFQNHPPPPQELNGRPLGKDETYVPEASHYNILTISNIKIRNMEYGKFAVSRNQK